MSIEEALRSKIVNTGGFSAVGRVYPLVAPQTTASGTSYVVYEVLYSEEDKAHNGRNSLTEMLIAYSCHGATASAVRSLAAEIRTILDGFSGTISDVRVGAILAQDESDEIDETNRLPVRVVVFEVQYYQ